MALLASDPIIVSDAQSTKSEERIPHADEEHTDTETQPVSKRIHNALTPFGRLSEDPLLHIVTLLMVPAPFAGAPDCGNTQVCSAMRGTLFATPGLWSDTDLSGSARRCALCLSRAQAVPLYLSYTLPKLYADPDLIWYRWSRDRYAEREDLLIQLMPRAYHVRVQCDAALPDGRFVHTWLGGS
jgi:hypothetical protein